MQCTEISTFCHESFSAGNMLKCLAHSSSCQFAQSLVPQLEAHLTYYSFKFMILQKKKVQQLILCCVYLSSDVPFPLMNDCCQKISVGPWKISTVCSWEGQWTVFLYRKACISSFYHSACHLLVNGEISSSLKRLEREVYLSLSFNAEIMNEWRFNACLPHLCKE